jgi:hypothetical protein
MLPTTSQALLLAFLLATLHIEDIKAMTLEQENLQGKMIHNEYLYLDLYK